MIRNTTILVSASDAAKKLNDLFNEDWQWRLKNYPELATYIGDNRYDNRLSDLSYEAIESRKAHEREMLARIRKIKRSELRGQDVISYDLFLNDKSLEVEGQQFLTELMPLTQMQGPQLDFPQLIGSMPYRTVKDYENYIARLEAFSNYIDQVIALMKLGIEHR